jgi:hypothetical protein
MLHTVVNLDAALINWAVWPGHTKGLLLTILDPLALAVCVKYAPKQRRAPLLWVFAAYLLCLVPGLFAGSLFQPAFFYFFQAIRITVVFYAVYLAGMNNQLERIVQGIAVAVIWNGFITLKSALSGAAQAAGVLGHQNLTGVVVNLSVPLLLAYGLRQRNGALYLAAVLAGGISAMAGGSRATIVFYGIAVIGTLIGSAALKPSGRKMAIVALGCVALVAASPFAVQKVAERGGVFSADLERQAFERAAEMMIADHPMGVGLNQYVVVANTQGYLGRAGVRWGQGARATNVHNAYLLTRVEGGLIALAGLLILLVGPLWTALRLAFSRAAPLRDVALSVAVALAVTVAHCRYEWIIVTIVPQYLIAILAGVTAAIAASAKPRKTPSLHGPKEWAGPQAEVAPAGVSRELSHGYRRSSGAPSRHARRESLRTHAKDG